MNLTDPRSPELDLFLSAQEPRERLIMLLAMCSAYPLLRHIASWKERIQDTRDELGLTLEEYVDLTVEARRVGEKLAKELEGAG